MRYLHNIGCKRIVILFWSLSSHCEHWEVGSSELLWEWHVFFFGGIDCVVIVGTEALSAWIGPMLADVVQLTHWTLGFLSINLTGRRKTAQLFICDILMYQWTLLVTCWSWYLSSVGCYGNQEWQVKLWMVLIMYIWVNPMITELDYCWLNIGHPGVSG